MFPFVEKLAEKICQKQRRYDDFVDRLSYLYTSALLLFFAFFITAKEQFGSPIKCWVSYEFRNGWEEYVQTLCYISNTYYLPYNFTIPKDVRERDYRKIGYYQWVPFILAAQCVLFYAPHVIWRVFHTLSGIDIRSITQLCAKIDLADEEKEEKILKILASRLRDVLRVQRRFRVSFWATFSYFFAKFLFVLNAWGQLAGLNKIFVSAAQNSTFWGVGVVAGLLNGREWEESGFFPRVTLCDVPERQLQNVHIHTVQCVLPINMVTEKIYLLLWFWFLLVGACTCVNLVFWTITAVPSYGRYRMVQRYLKIGAFRQSLDKIVGPVEKTVALAQSVIGSLENGNMNCMVLEEFVCDFLRLDGALLIRFLSNHSGELLASDLTFRLFEKFVGNRRNGQSRRKTWESDERGRNRIHEGLDDLDLI